MSRAGRGGPKVTGSVGEGGSDAGPAGASPREGEALPRPLARAKERCLGTHEHPTSSRMPARKPAWLRRFFGLVQAWYRFEQPRGQSLHRLPRHPRYGFPAGR